MRYLQIKDKRRRTLYQTKELTQFVLRGFIENMMWHQKHRVYAFTIWNNLPRQSTITRIRNRCILTNRPRGIYQKIGLSRLMFRKYAWKGKLDGIQKASW